MTFAQRLERAAAQIERRLEEILTLDQTHGAPQRLNAAMRHAVLGGGKRFRPFLLVESTALFGAPGPDAIDVAAALECIHCYSLVHDDLPAMDNDEQRRGRPTVWKAFDEWTAILAGDGLLTLAFEIVARAGLSDQHCGEVALRLAALAGSRGMVGGQCLDLEAEKLAAFRHRGADAIRRMQSMKTGALIRFACEAGAIIGGADASQRASLARFGEALGFAFQIADDLLDVEGDAESLGKAVAKDAALGKATLVSLLGIEEARAQLAHAQHEARAALEPFGARADVLREAVAFVASRRN